MSIGIYSAYNTLSIIPLESSAPLKTLLVGQPPLPELAGMTMFAYVKPRFAEPTEKISSTDDAGTYRSKFLFQYRPWSYSTGSPTFQFPSVGLTLAIDMLMESAINSTNGASYSFDASQVVTDDDGGTFTADARALETILASTIAADEKWLAVAATSTLPAGEVTMYLIDPEDGSVLYTETDVDLQNGSAHPFVGGTPPDGNSHFVRLGGQAPNNVVTNTSYDYKLGEMCLWHVAKTQAQLQALAQVGFAAINEPDGLILDWNFMLDWRVGNDSQVIDRSGNGNHGTISDASIRQQYFTDNPVPVFIPQITSIEHNEVVIDVFSGTSGFTAAGVWPAAATPTAQEIYDGTGAVAAVDYQQLDGINNVVFTLPHANTGTAYKAWFVQDTSDGGLTFTEPQYIAYTSAFKYSEDLITAKEVALGSKVNIKWEWYDSASPPLGNPKASGSTESTDANGLLEVTLPTSISTVKGEVGTMVLYLSESTESGLKESTAYHLAEVK